MTSLPIAACAVCVAKQEPNGLLLLVGVVLAVSAVLAVGLAWLDRRRTL